MTQENAGERNTQHEPSNGEILLEKGLEKLVEALDDCFALARSAHNLSDNPSASQILAVRDFRRGEISDAAHLLGLSCKIGQTLAKIRGGRFEHNINVNRYTSEKT